MVRISGTPSPAAGSGVRANKGKGIIAYTTQQSSGSGSKQQQRPLHLDRNPACFEQYDNFVATCVTAKFPTRSRIEDNVAPSASTSDGDFLSKQGEALDAFTKIKKACEESKGKLFFDRDFFLGSRAHLYPDGTPSDSTVGEPISIVRAEHVHAGFALFRDDDTAATAASATAHQLSQGQLGNAHLVAAIAGLLYFAALPSSKPFFGGTTANPLRRAFIAAEPALSLYAVMLSVNGSWQWVIIDGTLAAGADGMPLFSAAPSPRQAAAAKQQFSASSSAGGCGEFYFVLLQKALAKLLGSYDAIDGGAAAQTAVTLSGGIREKLRDLKRTKWVDFINLVNSKCRLIFCTVRDECAATTIATENNTTSASSSLSSSPSSLIGGHSFTVVEVRETTTTTPTAGAPAQRRGFVRLRSAWGATQSWKGAWSASSPLWAEQEAVATQLGGKPSDDDGSFWMSAGDFRKLMIVDSVFFTPGQAPTFSFPGTYGSKSNENGDNDGDENSGGFSSSFGPALGDVLLVKCEQDGVQLTVSINQPDSLCAVAMSNASSPSKQDHLIVKGLGDFVNRSWSMGIRASLHVDGAPTTRSFARSKKVLLATKSVVGADSVVFDNSLSVAKGGTYISLFPLVDEGTPYVVRVTATGGDKAVEGVTVMHLTSRLNGFVLGKREGVAIKDESQPKKGEEFVFADDDDENGDANENQRASSKNRDADDDEDDVGEECWDDDSAASSGRKRLPKEKLREIFVENDTDSSGFLEKSESFCAFLLLDPTASPRRIQTLITQADTSGDGRVSFCEWVRIARELGL